MTHDDAWLGIAREIHETALSKGWWDSNIPEALVDKLVAVTSAHPLTDNTRSAITETLKEYWPKRNVGEMMMLWVTEIAEAYEEYRKGRLDEVYQVDGKPEGGVIEVADLIIRILDTAHARGWDLNGAIRTKMDYNNTRPYRHGGKLA